MTDVVISQDFFPQLGGAHLWLYEIYRRWPNPVTILTQHHDATAEIKQAEAHFDALDHGALRIVREQMAVDEFNLLARRSRQQFWRAARLLHGLAGPEQATVHCLRAFPEGFSGLLCKLRRPRSTRLVVYAHGEEILVARSSRQLRLMAQAVYRHADLVIANSNNTVALVRSLCPKAKVVCIHPGVDAARYRVPAAESRDFRAHWQWPADTLVAGTIARMEPRKNHATVIRALAALRREGWPLAYVCGGDGEQREPLLALVRELRLEPWVRFPGRLSDEQKILTYGAADLHVMPSIQAGEMIEGFGIVFLEAAAAGIPSICGKVGGQAEAVLDGKTGLVVDGERLDEVQAAMARLAGDAVLRGDMGQAGRLWAADHDWSRVATAAFAAISAMDRA